MGKSIMTGVAIVILMISLMLIGITVASVITDGTTGTTTEQDYDQILDETIDEICTYLMIKDQKGKFSEVNGEQRINKIALWISPLVSQEIDVSQLTIQLDNGKDVMFLTYIGNAENMVTNSLFNHPIWNNMNGSNFGFISVVDLDESLVDFNLINDYSDNAYVVFQLPNDMALLKYEKVTVTLFPSTGITRTTVLKAPMPMSSVITFE